ncbi:MAG: type II secretion system F family protein [Acidimicrobiales bacterium]
MPVNLVLAAAAAAMSVPVLWWALSGERAGAVEGRNLRAGSTSFVDMRQAVLAHRAGDRAVRPAIERLASRARRFTPHGVIEGLEHRILLAGAPVAWTIERVLAGKVVLGAAGLVLGVARFLATPGLARFFMAAGGSVLGYLGPDLALHNRAGKRQKQIAMELPDTLDQITISVEAGLGFDAALSRTARTGKGPLAEELLRTLQDARAGMSRSQALRRLTARTDVGELHHFVLAVIQAESYGVPIAQVLRVQSAELRVKRRQKAEEKAMKIPVKVLFPLMVCILPCMFIVIIGPAGIRIARTFAGVG